MEVGQLDIDGKIAIARGAIGGSQYVAGVLIEGDDLCLAELRITPGGVYADSEYKRAVAVDEDGRIDESPLPRRTPDTRSIRAGDLRHFHIEDLFDAIRRRITDGAEPVPDGVDPDEWTALEESARRRWPPSDERAARLNAAARRLPTPRNRRGRPTDFGMLRALSQRYVQLDRDPKGPPVISTLAEEASQTLGREIPEATIESRLRAAVREGLLVRNRRGRRGGSRLGPNFSAETEPKDTTR